MSEAREKPPHIDYEPILQRKCEKVYKKKNKNDKGQGTKIFHRVRNIMEEICHTIFS
jgi:hypothetical protein